MYRSPTPASLPKAPATSALRSIERLIAAGMIKRQQDPHDARRKLLTLTQRGIDRARGYLDACSQDPATSIAIGLTSAAAAFIQL